MMSRRSNKWIQGYTIQIQAGHKGFGCLVASHLCFVDFGRSIKCRFSFLFALSPELYSLELTELEEQG